MLRGLGRLQKRRPARGAKEWSGAEPTAPLPDWCVKAGGRWRLAQPVPPGLCDVKYVFIAHSAFFFPLPPFFCAALALLAARELVSLTPKNWYSSVTLKSTLPSSAGCPLHGRPSPRMR